MGAYGSKLVTRYWQDKKTAQVIMTRQPENYKPSPEWHIYFREVRLLHHPESDCVFAEDVGTCLSALDDPLVVEVDLETYNYWNLIYSNPDI